MEVKSKCPYCPGRGLTPDPEEHLYTNPEKGVYFCFRCQATGVVKLRGGGLARPVSVKAPRQIMLFSFKLLCKESTPIYNYLLGRLPYTAFCHAVKWSPDVPGRAIFPIFIHDKLVFWTARAIGNREPKYLSSGSKSFFVYNMQPGDDWAVLCEGPFDALSTPNGVAIFGKLPSKRQVALLVNRYKMIYIALDGDADRKETIKSLIPYVRVKEVRIGTDDEGRKEDPASLGWREMQRRISEVGL